MKKINCDVVVVGTQKSKIFDMQPNLRFGAVKIKDFHMPKTEGF